MAMEYTEEQLNNFDKATIVQLFLVQQSQLQDIDRKLQLLLEQVAVLNNNRFGKSSEKLDTENQICFIEVDGNIVFFNEAEAVASLDEYVDEDETRPRGRKTKGRREKDIQGLPVNPVEHKMSEEELIAEFGEDGWYELEDEIYRRYSFTPMKVEIEEHHVGVYKSKKDNHFKKADHPAYLLRNSLVSKENRTDGNKHYMWVYRTGKMYEDRQIVLYDYQPSRNASHPRDFLKKFKGVCVTDGYQVYHTIEKEREDLKIAGCWSHAFCEDLLPWSDTLPVECRKQLE